MRRFTIDCDCFTERSHSWSSAAVSKTARPQGLEGSNPSLSASWENAYFKAHMKRVSLIIPITKERKILLQHKSAYAPNNPDTWCFFGGNIEEGESPKQAARREFKEELQVSVSDLNFFTKTFDVEKELERHYFSMACDIDIGILRNQQQEGDDIGYFSLEEMKSLKINQAHYQTLLHFFESKS